MMPIARFQMPDGRIARFEVPEGTTPEQAQSMMADALPKEMPAGDRFVKGLRDPVDAGAQLLTKSLPPGVVDAGNRLNNWLAEKTGLVGKLPEGGVDQQIREAEAAYKAQRGEGGIDWARMAGNVLNPANLAGGALIPRAATLGGRIASNAVAGGVMAGATAPVVSGDFLTEKGKQIAAGAIGGGVLPALTGGVARVVSPKAAESANLALLKSEGVKPTIGQTLGGRWNTLEEKAQSLPIVGDAIAMARGRSLEQFNKAAINRAAAPIGAKIDKAGQDGVREVGDAISRYYDDALGKVKFVQADPQFAQDLAQLRTMAESLTPDLKAKFDRKLNDILIGRMSPNGSMLGDVYKRVDSELGQLAARFGKSSAASEQELGDAFGQLKGLLNQQMRRTNPEVAGMLEKADEAWANLVRVEGAAKAGKNAEGLFTPAQLNNAAQVADSSVRKRAVARGTALMQDLANAGQQVVGNRVPNSFTADRALIAGGALGTAAIEPTIPLALAAGAASYTPPVQSLLSGLVSARPGSAKTLAQLIRESSAYLVPASAQLGVQVVNQ